VLAGVPTLKNMSELDQRRVVKAFGAVLGSTRTSAGITQEKFAELANIDRTYLSMLERGLRQPTPGKVISIADAVHTYRAGNAGSLGRSAAGG
jgi:transcriptional regulator with XRE-family HTH domain